MAIRLSSCDPSALLVAALGLVHMIGAACAPSLGIEGRWATFDDATHARRSIVEIVRDGNRLTGRIVEIFPNPGEDVDPICDRCGGADHGRKIRGLTILEVGPRVDAMHFNGTVLDPEDGRVYQSTVTLEPDGVRLRLRGYVGLPIFGRTEIWSRAE